MYQTKTLFCFVLLTLVCYSTSVIAQSKHGNVWVLGKSNTDFEAGTIMNFKAAPPELTFIAKEADMGGPTNVSMSDKNGALLFYSSGCAIWDREHRLMPNSEEILPNEQIFGCPENTASLIFGAIVLPVPCSTNEYYFINFEWNPEIDVPRLNAASSLQYSVVDMNGNQGLGIVADKYQPIVLDTLYTTNVSATRHANGRDWWVTVMKHSTNCLYSILLNENGFQEPIQYCTGIAWNDSGSGSSCFSPDGSTYVRYNPQNGIHVYDYDNMTGAIRFREMMPTPDSTVTIQSGTAISPNSRYLYVSAREHLYQYDLAADIIENSRKLVGIWDGTSDPQSTIFHQSMLAPDGKIYITSWVTTNSLHVIHEPNMPGLACNLEQRGIQFPAGDIPAWNGPSVPNIPWYGPEPDNSPCDSLISNTLHLSLELDITLSPNPVTDILLIGTNHATLIDSYLIYDLHGRKISSGSLPSVSRQSIDVLDLTAGVYFLELRSQDKRTVRKFVKG